MLDPYVKLKKVKPLISKLELPLTVNILEVLLPVNTAPVLPVKVKFILLIV